jgi:shikimate dehydrogenase
MSDVHLGLIGDNIQASRSPLLHRLAGRQVGLGVRYDRLIPRDLGLDFDGVFDRCQAAGYRGVNVTYPYKEHATARVRITDPQVRLIGAINTVVFSDQGPLGYNTDFSGFQAAWRGTMGAAPPGIACMIGAGGVGRAVAFGLLALGADEIRLLDHEPGKAEALAKALRIGAPDACIRACRVDAEAAHGVDGVINCTPVGMGGLPGTPLDRALIRGATWAFDAVYTPVNTQFLQDAAAEGATILSGYELFFHQGVDAWDIFVGRPISHDRLRQDLLSATDAEAAI